MRTCADAERGKDVPSSIQPAIAREAIATASALTGQGLRRHSPTWSAIDGRTDRVMTVLHVRALSNTDSFSARMDESLADPGQDKLQALRRHGQRQFQALFTWPAILRHYEELLTKYLPCVAPALLLRKWP